MGIIFHVYMVTVSILMMFLFSQTTFLCLQHPCTTRNILCIFLKEVKRYPLCIIGAAFGALELCLWNSILASLSVQAQPHVCPWVDIKTPSADTWPDPPMSFHCIDFCLVLWFSASPSFLISGGCFKFSFKFKCVERLLHFVQNLCLFAFPYQSAILLKALRKFSFYLISVKSKQLQTFKCSLYCVLVNVKIKHDEKDKEHKRNL